MHDRGRPRKAVAGHSPSRAALAALVIGNVALAFGPLFVRMADTGPVATGFWRMTLGAPVLAALALGSGARPAPLGRGLWIALALGGVAFAGDLGSWHVGILRTTLANATLFGNCATLFYPIYGFVVARLWPSRTQALALLLAALGAGLLMGRSYQLDPRHLTGDLLCLLAGLLYTVYFVLMARVRAVLASLPALALSTVASILPLLLLALAMGEKVVPDDWRPLLLVAAVSQILGQGMMIYVLGRLSPLLVGIALLIQPVVSGAIGWAIFGERPGAADWLGAAMVAVALVLVRRGDVALAQDVARAQEPA